MVRSSVPIISGSPDCFDATAPEESLQRIAENSTAFVSLIGRHGCAWATQAGASLSRPLTAFPEGLQPANTGRSFQDASARSKL